MYNRFIFFILSFLIQFSVVAQNNDTLKIFFISDCQAPLNVEKIRFSSNRNQEATKLLFDNIARQKPANLFMLGDITGAGSTDKKWKSVDSFIENLRKNSTSIYAIPGNHEYVYRAKKGIENFNKRFPHSTSGYMTKIGDIGIVLLNSNFNRLSSEENLKQKEQFMQVMDSLDNNPKIKTIILCSHHSPFTNSKVVAPNSAIQKEYLPRFFASTKSKLYISGHSHNLEYFNFQDRRFLVIGGGGGLKQPLKTGTQQEYSDLINQKDKPL